MSETTYTSGNQTWTFTWDLPVAPPDDDDPPANVREPRRPKPSPTPVAAHAG